MLDTNTGMLTVTGTSSSDTINLGIVSSTLNVTENSILHSFSASAVTSLSIHAGDGNDRVTLDKTIHQNAFIDGGAGHDKLTGGAGHDTLTGGDGDDALNGGQGDDRLLGGAGRDKLNAGKGNDTLLGEDGDDKLAGAAGSDQLDGGAGNDLLGGGRNNDTLIGNDGDDTLNGGRGADLLQGGAGLDTAQYTYKIDPVRVSLDDIANDGQYDPATGLSTEFDNVYSDIENLQGGAGDDLLIGSDADNVLSGNGGSDTLIGGAGSDTLLGGDGDDTLDAADGTPDTLIGGTGGDTGQVDGGVDTSTEVETLEEIAPIAAPTALTAAAISSTQIDLSWTDNSDNENGFAIEASLDGTTFTALAAVGAGITTYSATGLEQGVKYYFRLRAYNAQGYSAYSNTADAATILPAPTNVSSTAVSGSEINLSWVDNATGEDGYVIEQSTSADFVSPTTFTVGPNARHYSAIGLAAETTYYFRVKAKRGEVYSEVSNSTSDTTENIGNAAESEAAGSLFNMTVEFGDFPAGSYQVIYVEGSLSYYGDPSQMSVNLAGSSAGNPPVHGIRGHHYRIAYNGGTASVVAPGAFGVYSTQEQAEAASSGRNLIFDHTGGAIGVTMNDWGIGAGENTSSDNTAGSPNPTWKLVRLDELPTITISANDAAAGELPDPNGSGSDPNPGQFTFTRAGGDLSESLTIRYTLSGTATPEGEGDSEADYASPPGGSGYGGVYSLTFAANEEQKTLDLTPLNDSTAEAAESVILSLRSDADYRLGSSRTATVNIEDNDGQIDLDLDSDNNNGLATPGRTDQEDGIEDDAAKPGKIITVNDDDSDGDGIPDFADGYNRDGTAGNADDTTTGEQFVPMVLELSDGIDLSQAKFKFDYLSSDPMGVTRTGAGTAGDPYLYTLPAAGRLRLWTKDGSQSRSITDDFIISGQSYRIADLPAATQISQGIWRLWVESVMFNSELGNEQIKISLDSDGDGPAGFDAVDTIRLTSLDLDLGFNLKRIPADVVSYDPATREKPYQFWLNDDHDATGEGPIEADGADVQVDANNPPDSQDNQISNLRDMEDFSVFEINSHFVYLASLGEDYKLIFKFTETNGANPSLKLYRSDSGLHPIYFSNSDRSFANDNYLGEVTTNSAVELPLNIFSDRVSTQLLFEGRTAGQGALTLQLKKGEQIVADAKGYLDLRPITQLYDHYTVGDTETMDWDQIPLTDTQIQSAVANPHSPENPDYVLFVHGWRMLRNERRSYAETAYKRMFWQGYNGGFGLFSWPTEWNSGTNWSHATDQENYDRSERKAYWSGWGLHGVMERLNQQYPGKVDVFAHSMGNIVVSEALRIEATSQSPERIVDVYIASQAASVAHAYDANRPATETDESTQTPEVYASYPPTGQPYYGTIDLAANKLVNFYNPQDYALGVGWMANQDTKPDGAWDYDSDGWFRDGLLELLK